ncbi:MAG: hypothetical protein ABUS57_10105 [Pseudomonadota bacterium]
MWKTVLLSLLFGATLAAPLAGDAWAEGRHHRGDYQDQDNDRGRGRGDDQDRGGQDRGGWGQQPAIQPNWAQPRRDFRDDNNRQQQQRTISVREAAERVRARFGGELISASMEGGTYVLRWRFPNQMVEDIRVDASSGQVYR